MDTNSRMLSRQNRNRNISIEMHFLILPLIYDIVMLKRNIHTRTMIRPITVYAILANNILVHADYNYTSCLRSPLVMSFGRFPMVVRPALQA